MNNSIYQDIAKRTGGDIYIGVVGPVRSGKSTFINKLLSVALLDKIEDEYDRKRTLDSLPQAASGRTVMTTEPKFIPDEAVRVSLADGISVNLRALDCVGYMVDGALGAEENGEVRIVKTPWSEEGVDLPTAAEIGTDKVISEHATIAVMVTTDGSITDIPREGYVEAEERAVAKIKEAGRPFAIVLNSKNPESPEAVSLAETLEKKYSAPVALLSCEKLNLEDVNAVLGLILGEFPVRELTFDIPTWTMALGADDEVRQKVRDIIDTFSDVVSKIGDVERRAAQLPDLKLLSIDAGVGACHLEIPLSRSEFFSAISRETGLDVSDDFSLFSNLSSLAKIKKRYEKIEDAETSARKVGYGAVRPTKEDLVISEPAYEKQAGGYALKLCMSAELYHIVKSQINIELNPVIGTKEQAEDVVAYLTSQYNEDPGSVFDYNMFGRSIFDLASDAISQKLANMSVESGAKLGDTLTKVVNEGASGLICILL
ncbi:MAG: stage IV sporulation protein A [Clostridia bacterium]|nr:stage IV sporulation protein A [Clostridia bacterium]